IPILARARNRSGDEGDRVEIPGDQSVGFLQPTDIERSASTEREYVHQRGLVWPVLRGYARGRCGLGIRQPVFWHAATTSRQLRAACVPLFRCGNCQGGIDRVTVAQAVVG